MHAKPQITIQFLNIFLTFVFLFSTFDIPLDALRRDPSIKKCCCNPLVICRCQDKHKVCPMKKNADRFKNSRSL